MQVYTLIEKGEPVLADRFPLQVTSREMLTERIASFVLVDPERRPLPPYQAGAHIEVDILPGLIRRYSLCGDPEDRSCYRIAVQLDPHSRGGSAIIHSHWSIGDTVAASAPRNNFPLETVDARTILVAGGIGVTPIMPMAFQLARQGLPFELHYTTRSAPLMAFRQQFTGSSFAEKIRLYFDDAPTDARFDAKRLIERLDRDAHIYVCGPAGFNSIVTHTARQAGFSSQQLHQESFAVLRSGANEQPFTVEIASTGQQFTIPGDQTILEVLDQAGVFVPSTCRQGICGICITNVLSGPVDHRDDYLAPEERAKNDVVLPCCSRAAAGCLVLDL